jgi:SAM-dependent methyltransferase
MNIFYAELAAWWPLISPVEDYREEAAEFVRVLAMLQPAANTLLELGSGGGHNAYYLKERFKLTLSDLSEPMLEASRRLNPECEHVAGDMRTLALERQFDLVFAHDGLDYMTSEADLASAIATAYRHCKPAGYALFVPDAVHDQFEPSTDSGGSDGEDGRAIRFLEWSYDPDPTDTMTTTHYSFVAREANGQVRSYAETHTLGLFPRETWFRLIAAAGFAPWVLTERTTEARTPRLLFIGRRPG